MDFIKTKCVSPWLVKTPSPSISMTSPPYLWVLWFQFCWGSSTLWGTHAHNTSVFLGWPNCTGDLTSSRPLSSKSNPLGFSFCRAYNQREQTRCLSAGGAGWRHAHARLLRDAQAAGHCGWGHHANITVVESLSRWQNQKRPLYVLKLAGLIWFKIRSQSNLCLCRM